MQDLHWSVVEVYVNLTFDVLDTTPPKTVLNEESTLVDSECVPSAVLYYGTTHPVPTTEDSIGFLKEELFSKFVSPSIASLDASRSM